MSKRIWLYWHQGFEHAPPIIEKCISSWRSSNSDWKISTLDWSSVRTIIDVTDIETIYRSRSINLAGVSDLIRLALISKYGGLWIDATVLALKPLEQWLSMDQSFFAFSDPGKDRLLSTWFLLGKEDSIISKVWYTSSLDYWLKRSWSNRPYYWCHYLFNRLYSENEEIRKEWNRRQKISADGPHYFVPYRQKFFEPMTRSRIKEFEEADLPLVKLTYKCLANGYPQDSMIDYLLNQRGR